jgi:hypothetical protein
MTVGSRVLARLSGLGPAESRDIAVDADLRGADA